MTLTLKTIAWYEDMGDQYVAYATGFRQTAVANKVWWKPRSKKRWLFLIKMAGFYINNAKDSLQRLEKGQ